MTIYYRSVTLTFPEPVRVESPEGAGTTFFREASGKIRAEADTNATIDLHYPTPILPTTMGSIIRLPGPNNTLLALTKKGQWASLVTGATYDPETIQHTSPTILFTAPAPDQEDHS